MYKNFYKFSDSTEMLKLFISLVRSHTDYDHAIWDPLLSKDIQTLEDTQEFALKVCFKVWRVNYDLLLSRSGLLHLSTRREFLKLCLILNFFSGRVVFACSLFFRKTSIYPNHCPNASCMKIN